MSLIGTLLVASAALAATPDVPRETMVEAPGPNGPLRGTMLAPANGGSPTLLIIPGSGPTDRDGNSPLGIKASSYRLLAEALAAQGVGSVRIDKRGMLGSSAAVADGNAVTISDYVADTQSWVTAIKKQTGAGCVWVLGHSEGGLVALAGKDAPSICGLILVSTPGRPVGEVMRAQLSANPANAPVLDQALGAIDALEAGRKVDVSAFHPALQNLFSPRVQGFLISLLSYDPAKLLRDYGKPVLILQGGNDLQVSVEDAKLLSAANPQAKLVLLPAVNHALKDVPPNDAAANMAAYGDPSLPLGQGVAEAIGTFIKANSPKSR